MAAEQQTARKDSPADVLNMIEVILKDELVATFSHEDGGLMINFLDGQKFRLTLDEVA